MAQRPRRGVKKVKSEGLNPVSNYNPFADPNSESRTGVFIGTVKEVEDDIRMGRVWCHVPATGAHPETLVPVQFVTPYGGTTNWLEAIKDVKTFGPDIEESQGGTIKSYGMWFQPPAKETRVLLVWVPNEKFPFYLGSTINVESNHMLGGLASSRHYDVERGKQPYGPVGERNPNDDNADKEIKPTDRKQQAKLEEQGLEKDYTRGHSMSSARRETPSRVFGITTRDGHAFSMDDGDKDGNSKGIRLRSREGAQILIDDTNEFIFVVNHHGNAWVEIDKDGKIDVYAKDDISITTEADFNIHAKGNFNVQADQGINMKAMREDVRIQALAADMHLKSGVHFYHTAGSQGHVNCGSHYYETAPRIDMNGPTAQRAESVKVHQHPQNKDITSSASARVPEHHPWKGVTAVQDSFTQAKGKSR